MCFYIKENSERLTKELKQSKTPIVAYKSLFREKLLKDGDWCYRSPIYLYYKWEKGLNISNRPVSFLYTYEKWDRCVYNGFHFYRDYKKAFNGNFNPKYGHVIVKFEIDPKDIVCVNEKEIVATQATLIEEVTED